MTPDQLRELAEALDQYTDDCDRVSYQEDTVMRAADYLRAQADAQPVGYATANGLRMLQQDDATVLLYKHDYLIRPDHVPLYTHPAPAAPQVELDAQRYRWLRGDSCPDHSVRWTQWEVRCWRAPQWTADLRRSALDAAIDAAMGLTRPAEEA